MQYPNPGVKIPSFGVQGPFRAHRRPANQKEFQFARLDYSGRVLVDGQGRMVIVRGFNMINKLPPYTLSGAGFGEEDAAPPA